MQKFFKYKVKCKDFHQYCFYICNCKIHKMIGFIAKKYDYFMNDIADQRVKEWFGFSSPVVLVAIITTYLLLIYYILPSFMKNRKPYSLKTFLYYYNIFQIIYCAVLIFGILKSGCKFGCQPIDYSSNPQALAQLNWIYYTYILKMIELLETVVFVLRKKFNQVSRLHVYHHASTLALTWVGVKYIGGGMAGIPVVINSSIHILMYTYYFLSNFGPKWQKRLSKWKPKLTMFQMIQFCILILHALQTLHPDCHVPKQILFIYLPDVLIVFYMFWQFYKKSYLIKKNKKI